MASDEREVSIRISASNLTGPEFDKVRAALAQVRQTSESTSASAQKLQRDYQALQQASMKLADASGQVYTDMTRVRTLTQQFGGGGAQRSAEEYAAAVTRVGGASKLTANEQAQVNRVVTEAIAKYRALGQEAPGHLVALQKATTQTKSMLSSLGGTITSVAAGFGVAFSAQAVVQGAMSFTRHVFDQADSIKDLSERMGVGIERAQQFGTAWRQSGTDIETGTGAIGKMSRSISEGSDATRDSLRGLGLSLEQVRAMKPEDAYLAITDAIQRMPNPMDQSRVAVELFGKAGEKMLPGIREGFRGAADAAKAMASETVIALADAKQSWEDFQNDLTIGVGNFIVTTYKQLTATKEQMRGAVTAAELEAFEKGGGADKYYDSNLKRILFRKDIALNGGMAPAGDGGKTGPTEEQKKSAELEKKGAEALLKIRREYTDLIEKDTLSRYEFEMRQIDRWLAEERRGFQGSLVQRQQYYQELDRMADARRLRAGVEASLTSSGLLSEAILQDRPTWNFQTGTDQLISKFYNPALNNLPMAKTFTALKSPVPSLSDFFRQYAPSFTEQNRFDAQGHPITSVSTGKMDASVLFGGKLSSTILSSVTGGGNIGASLGSGIGQQIGTSLSTSLGKSLSESGAGALAKGLGGALVGAIPVIGALAGPMVGKLVDIFTGGAKANNLRDQLKAKFGDAGGAALQELVSKFNDPKLGEAYSRFMRAGSEKDVQGAFDDMQKVIAATQATLDKYGLSLNDLQTPQERLASQTKQLTGELSSLKQMGFSNTQIAKGMAGSLNELVRSALDAGGKIPAAFQPLIKQLIESGGLADDVAAKLLGIPEKAKTPWQEMQSIMEEFGIDIEKAGTNFQQARLLEGGEELARKWRVLVDNGADVVEVNAKMAEKANDFLRNALRWGLEVPASMKPMLEKMLETGELTDENGDKLKDLGRVKWGADAAKQFDPLVQALNRLVDYFERDLPGSLDTLRANAERGFKIPVEQTGGGGGGGGKQDSDGDGVPDDEDAVPFNPQYYSNGGIAEGRQVAVIAERGRREIVGTEQFIASALASAMRQVSNTHTGAGFMAGGGSDPIHLSVVLQLEGRVLDARIKDVAQTAAARGELQIPSRAVTVQVARV